MYNIGTHREKTRSGFTQIITRYQAHNCEGCPVRHLCHQSKYNRTIQVNHTLNKYKQQIRNKLNSEEGKYDRIKRPVDIEPVFANIKQNKNFKRFNLRGLKKTEIEIGLIALAHNLKKLAA